jgi:hypothetical protein
MRRIRPRALSRISASKSTYVLPLSSEALAPSAFLASQSEIGGPSDLDGNGQDRFGSGMRCDTASLFPRTERFRHSNQGCSIEIERAVVDAFKSQPQVETNCVVEKRRCGQKHAASLVL